MLFFIKSLLEGGTATGCPPIERKHLPQVLALVSQASGIPINDLHRLGSTGDQSNKPMMGDVDLAVDINKYSFDQIHQQMVAAFGADKTYYNPGTKVGSYAVPINGSCVQVDLMFVQNVKWSSFAYSSRQGQGPGYEKYKGMISNALLSAVAATTEIPGFTYFLYQDGQLRARANFVIDKNKGLHRKFGYLKQKKTGGYNKTETATTPEEFLELFPDAKINAQGRMLVDDPQQVVEMLFGPGTPVEATRTVDGMMRLIKSKFDEQRQEQIFIKAKSYLMSMLREQFGTTEMPEEIMRAGE